MGHSEICNFKLQFRRSFQAINLTWKIGDIHLLREGAEQIGCHGG